MDEIECPQCGAELMRCEDEHGVADQCVALDCLGCFDADEIEED